MLLLLLLRGCRCCRSTVLLLSLLPLTERCVSLRQQAALKLLAKLLPQKKQPKVRLHRLLMHISKLAAAT
jgi:hypothetical protein